MNAASLVVLWWLVAQAPAEGVDPFAQPQPDRGAPAARIRLQGDPRAADPPRNPLRESAPKAETTAPAQTRPLPSKPAPARLPARDAEDEPQPLGDIIPVQRTVAAEEAAEGSRSDVEATSGPRLTAKDFIAGLLVAPEGEGLSGQPMRLVDALTRHAGRAPQDIVRAYWELAGATALYHQRRREAAQLETLNGPREPSDALQLALGAARAALAESKVSAIAAQQRLRAIAPLPGGALPTVADVPHTGAYHTYFQEIFGGRPAPPELTLLAQTLPLEKEAVQARFQAALAAADRCEQAWGQQQGGQGSLSDTLAAIAESGRQERAFVQSVLRYNQDIANYALRVAPNGVSPRTMVAMLIKDPLQQRAAATNFDGQVIPAGATELLEATEHADLIPPDQGGAPRTFLPPSGETDGLGRPMVRSTYEPRLDRQPQGPQPDPQPNGATGDTEQRSEFPGNPFPSGPVNTRKPPLSESGTARPTTARPTMAPDAVLYGGLDELPLNEQAANLAKAVFSDALPFAAQAVSWQDAQRRPNGPGLYWQTRAAWARWQAWDQAASLLSGLRSKLPEQTQTSAQLACRAAQLAAQAEAADARVELRTTQFAWAMTLGINASLRQDANLPLPAGQPDLHWLEADKVAATSPTAALWRTAIQQRASAVIAADAARAQAAREATTGVSPADALNATRRQTEATLAFADALANGQLAAGAGANQAPTAATTIHSTLSNPPTSR